jgi:hypothetical protein
LSWSLTSEIFRSTSRQFTSVFQPSLLPESQPQPRDSLHAERA